MKAADVELNALAKDLAAASGRQFQDVAASLVLDAANQVQTFAKSYAPVDTGALKDSIVIEVSSNGLSAKVTAGTDHAVFMEYGTGTRGEFPGKPIVTKAKAGGMLAFKTKDGTIVYTKQTINPGVAPRPFMRPAVERIALPLANALGNNAQIFIVDGPNKPETLKNAPATSPYNTTDGFVKANRVRSA